MARFTEATSPNGAMGKLLFVKTYRVGGIVGLVFCFGLIAAGVWIALSGAYAAILLVPVGLFLGKFFLKAATMKHEIYEEGFVSKSATGGTSARYADLKSIARGATRANGVLMTNIHFVTQSGAKTTVTNEEFAKDAKMAQLLTYSCRALANTWMKTLERQSEVIWMEKDSVPTLKIRKDGVIVKEKSGIEEFIPLSQFHVKPGFALTVEIFNGDKKLIKVNSGAPNYYVGETLLAMLAENRSRPATAGS